MAQRRFFEDVDSVLELVAAETGGEPEGKTKPRVRIIPESAMVHLPRAISCRLGLEGGMMPFLSVCTPNHPPISHDPLNTAGRIRFFPISCKEESVA